ncbi:MAG TPA: protein translocase subunit SecDF, partial [Puia sp.]
MRALVSIFAALLIAISLYQLSFTWFVNKHESAMEAKAKSYVHRLYPLSAAQKYPADKEARALYQDTLDQLLAFKKDSLLKISKDDKITWWGTTYQKSKESELLLGLDLQGGISVTLDVALDGLIKNLSNNPRDPQLLKALSLANQKKVASTSNLVDLFAQSYKEINPTAKLAPLFANANRNKLRFDASDEAVIAYLHDMSNAAMQQTFKVLRTRIDQFGVAQPSISLDQNRGIISVELAGATDPDRVRKYLQSTANLQFWEVYNLGDLANAFTNADRALEKYLNGVKEDSAALRKDSIRAATGDTTTEKDTTTGPNAHPLLNQRVIHFAQASQDPKTGQARYQPFLAGVLIKDTATVNSWLNNPIVRNYFPQDLKFVYGKPEVDDDGKVASDVA